MKRKALSLNDIADAYDREHSGRKARTLPIEDVMKWANQHPTLFVIRKGYYYWRDDQEQRSQ